MDEFQKFLGYQGGLLEPGLCIAVKTNISDVLEECLQNGYTQIGDINREITGTGDQCVVLNSENVHDVYNVVAQYGSGQWGPLGDRWVNPQYEKLSLVVIVTKDVLESLGDMGRKILSKVGISIQI